MRRSGLENILSGSRGVAVSRKQGDREVGTSDEERRAETDQPTARKVGNHLSIVGYLNIVVKIMTLFSFFPSWGIYERYRNYSKNSKSVLRIVVLNKQLL